MAKVDIYKIEAKHNHRIFTPEEDRFGLWRTYVDDDTKARGRRAITAKDKNEFYSKLQEYYNGKDTDQEQKKTKQTLTSLFPEWLEYKRTDTTAESYIVRIRSEWKRWYQGQPISQIPLDNLTPEYLEKWLRKIAKGESGHGEKKRTYYNATMIIRQMLKYARKHGIITQNPMDDVEINTAVLRPLRKKPDKQEVFSNREIKQIRDICWNELRSPDYHRRYVLAPASVLLQEQTGLRVGELAALRYDDIEGDYIHVQRMYRKETQEVIQHAKTDAGDRYVLLTRAAHDIIEWCRKEQERRGSSTTGYIFSTTSAPLPVSAIQKMYRIINEQIGGAMRNSHKMRKTWVSVMIDSGTNINTVRKMGGHESEETTLRNYTYDRSTTKEQQERINEALKYDE